MKLLALGIAVLTLSGCSVFGESKVENAPYKVIENFSDPKIEVRNYPQMVLVSAPMGEDGRNSAFRKLFGYISGDNVASNEIAMTAPVLMDGEEKGQEIPMTAPVFMDEDSAGQDIPMTAPVFMDEDAKGQRMMSFVMPADFTLESTPKPTDPDVVVSEVEDYQVAAIIFSGRLSDANIEKHRNILEQWIIDNDYVVTGAVKTAGYNAPFTLPTMRRNEVIIPVIKE